MHYLLLYNLAPDYLERRGEFRAEHLTLAWRVQERVEPVLAGALADPTDEAVLLFKGESPEGAKRFVEADSYVARWARNSVARENLNHRCRRQCSDAG